MTEHEKRIREALEVGPVQYACHCDLEPGMAPDGCVLDYGKPEDCVYARHLHAKGLCKTDCEEWKPINAPKSTVEVSASNLRALLADLDAVRVKAARYDWLRNQPVEVPAHGPDMTIWDGNGSGDALRGVAADEAIDAALKGATA